MKIRYLPLLLLPLLLLLFLSSHPVRSLSCYKDCIRENIAGGADPIYYHEEYSLLESSCLEEVQTCEEPLDEDVYCASVRLGPDHYIGDHDDSIVVESVEHFFCMYISKHSEGDFDEETCAFWGGFLGDDCTVTSLCEEEGCNSPPASPPSSSSSCYSCELFTDQFSCPSVDIPGSCDLVNCTAGVSQCYAKFSQDSCSVSLGCVSPDITGCEDGSSTCSVCAAENCTESLTSDAICGYSSDSGCVDVQHECRSCTYPACDTIPDSCPFQNCSTGVTECYSQINSCQITIGCKPESFSCEDDSDSCSICKDDECSLNKSSICENEGECASSHQCITCSHPLCGNLPDSCYLQECGSGVQQCYTKVEGCLVTRGCKTPDVTCETDNTCAVCEGDECDLPDQSLCEPGGGCEEKIVCNSCNLHLSNKSLSLTTEAESKCLKIDTCSKDAKGCIVYVEEKDCNIIVGCDENDKKETDFIRIFSGFLSDLKTILEKLPDENVDIIKNCEVPADPVIGRGSGSRTRINSSLLLLGLYYIIT